MDVCSAPKHALSPRARSGHQLCAESQVSSPNKTTAGRLARARFCNHYNTAVPTISDGSVFQGLASSAAANGERRTASRKFCSCIAVSQSSTPLMPAGSRWERQTDVFTWCSTARSITTSKFAKNFRVSDTASGPSVIRKCFWPLTRNGARTRCGVSWACSPLRS